MKHTIGPWKITVYDSKEQKLKKNNTNCFYIITSKDGCPIQTPSKNIANTNLIASAPEMLEALNKIWSAIENGTIDKDFFELRELYRNTMNKATGVK